MHGVLIVGKQGIGKSILQKVFSAVFGESNVVAPHNENLTGQFTGWAKHCQIVVINELMQVDKKDFNNKIKPFITEPHVEIREMYKAPYVIKNCMNIIAFSNHDNAVYVEKDDRRWFIIKSDAVKKEAEYYDTLIDKMNTCSGEVLNYLQNLDISEFREGAAPPMTAAKRDIIEYSTPDLDAWITETIESCAAPCDADIITIDDLRNALPRQLQNGYATANRIGKILRDCNCIRSTERITVGGVKKRFWVLRNYDKYKSLEQLKSAVSTTYGGEGVESNQFVS
jgi:phage/plasmid-associated DNA primase